MAKKDLESKSIEELEAIIQDITDRRIELRDEARDVQAVMNRKAAAAEAERLAANLSDDQKAALAQVIKAEGIKPTSAVGTPGAKG